LRPNGIAEVDVAVVGGGPAGTATALPLAQRGHAVLVIERTDYGDLRIGETLPPAVRPLLGRIGLWERFAADQHRPAFGIRSAWGQPNLSDNDFVANPYGCGWHLDRARFDASLAFAAEQAGAQVLRAATVLSVEAARGGWQIEVACAGSRRRFRARQLVDATGRRAVIARGRGARRITWDRLVGIVSFHAPRSAEDSLAAGTLIEAVEDGWFYSAVLPDRRLVIAYMTDADLYAKARKASPTCWQQRLEGSVHTRARAQACDLAAGPVIRAASSSRLDRASGRNWLAVGDAAAALDPLSSQGICQALQSGLAAADVIGECLARRGPAGRSLAARHQGDFDAYLLARRRYYGLERRFADAPFWRRRR
jgi:flavin-dependent dehydrogenase